MKTVQVQVMVDVDVDMSDIETGDLIEELQSRGYDTPDGQEVITEMFYAFKLGKIDRAIEIARQIAQNHTGMIL